MTRGRSLGIILLGLPGILILTLFLFGLPIVESLKLIIQGAFGDQFGWSRTAVKTTPLLLTGLGMVVAWRSGVFNIGGEGQFVMGALFGATFAKFSSLSGPAMLAGILLSCLFGGALWASVAGWLYTKRGVEVVISTILLNFIAIQVLSWAVSGPLQESKHQLLLTDTLPESSMLPKLNRQMDVNLGLVIGLLMAAILFVYLFRSNGGFLLRLSGANPRVARANRINTAKTQMIAMGISGGLCGLAGGIEYTGIAGQLGQGFAQGWGFLGIPVALLGMLHPLATVASAVYFGALFAGSENLARFSASGTTLVYVIQAMAVLGYVALRRWAERIPLPVESE